MWLPSGFTSLAVIIVVAGNVVGLADAFAVSVNVQAQSVAVHTAAENAAVTPLGKPVATILLNGSAVPRRAAVTVAVACAPGSRLRLSGEILSVKSEVTGRLAAG